MEIHSNRSVPKVSYRRSGVILTLFAGWSAVLGFALDAIIAAVVGAGRTYDVFVGASAIPALLVAILATPLSVALVPRLQSQRAVSSNSSWSLGRYVTFVSVLAAIGLVIILAIAADGIVTKALPGFAGSSLHLAKVIFLISLLTFAFQSLVLVMSAVLNTHERFTVPGILPALNGVFMVAFAIAFASRWSVIGLAAAYAASAGIQVLILFLAFRQGRHAREKNVDPTVIRSVLRNASSLMIAGVAYNGMAVIDRYYGSRLPAGSLSHLAYASRLGMAFANIIAAGVSAPLLTRLAGAAARRDEKDFSRTITIAVTALATVVVPALAVAAGTGDIGVAMLLRRRHFTMEDSSATALALLAYIPAIVVMVVGRPIIFAFHALSDFTTPVWLNSMSLMMYGTLAFFVLGKLHAGYLGLACIWSAVHILLLVGFCIRLRAKAPIAWRPDRKSVV